MHLGRMIPVATAPNQFAASVIAARLGSEGIVTELRGCSGAYPLGEIDVLVEESAYDDAREILLVDEIESTYDGLGGEAILRAPAALWFVVAVMVLTAVVSVARLFS